MPLRWPKIPPRWSARWTRARALGARARELFPLTAAGLLVGVGSGLAVWRYGVLRSDLILLAIGALGLLTVLLGVLSVLAGALRLRLAVPSPAPPLGLETGRAARTGYTLPSLWWLPLARVELRWQSPPAEAELVRERGQLVERVTPTRRGEWPALQRAIEVFDPFGLAAITLRVEEDRAVAVTPDTGQLRTLPVLQGLSGGDEREHPTGPQGGDPLDMRRYTPGDPIRYVLWKVYARSGELMVRTPERAVAPVRRTVAYLVGAEGDEPAAGAARRAVELGVLGEGWAFGADGCAEVARTAKDAMSVIRASAQAGPAQQGAGLGAFLAQAGPGGLSRAVVFVPGTPGPWLGRLCGHARDPGLLLEFVVCADGARKERPPGRLRRWLVRPEERPPRHANLDELVAVVRALSPLGRVTVVDRARGRVVPATHLNLLTGRAA